MRNLRLIIFDMDGLMFDTERVSYNSWKQASSNFGYVMDEDVFKKTLGINLEGTKKIFMKHFGEKFPFEKIRKEKLLIGEKIIKTNGVPVKEGLYELLSYLSKANIKKAVATSTARNRTLDLLRMANIDRYFDYILCGDEVENSKPHPEIFLKAANKLGCNPESCLVLEDSEAGVLAAYRAGMLPIMIPDMKEPGEETKKLIYKQMSSLREVKLYLERLSATVD